MNKLRKKLVLKDKHKLTYKHIGYMFNPPPLLPTKIVIHPLKKVTSATVQQLGKWHEYIRPNIKLTLYLYLHKDKNKI